MLINQIFKKFPKLHRLQIYKMNNKDKKTPFDVQLLSFIPFKMQLFKKNNLGEVYSDDSKPNSEDDEEMKKFYKSS